MNVVTRQAQDHLERAARPQEASRIKKIAVRITIAAFGGFALYNNVHPAAAVAGTALLSLPATGFMLAGYWL